MKTTININSQKPMVLLPLEDYEALVETIEILTENPKIVNELKKEKENFLKGKFFIYNSNNKKLSRNSIKSKRKTA
jgi:PHD/YefM family antitoxin component YafN of YafNO toxin-antitoxin module